MRIKMNCALAGALIGWSALSFAAAPGDWLVASEDGTCDATDVDFSGTLDGFATCAFSNVMTTHDGGLNWHVLSTDLQQSLLWAHAEGPDVLHAARRGLYRSADAGLTWTELGNLSSFDDSIFDAHWFDQQHIVLLKGADLLYSDNAGNDWTLVYPAPFQVYFSKLHFPTSQVGFASGGITTGAGSHGNVARTVDGGLNWTLLSFAQSRIYAADFFDAQHGVVATQDNQLLVTSDGAATWQLLGPTPGNDLLMDIGHRDAQHWYAVSFNGAIYETRDAGATWETGYQDPQRRALVALSVKDGAVVVVGDGGQVLYEDRIMRNAFE